MQNSSRKKSLSEKLEAKIEKMVQRAIKIQKLRTDIPERGTPTPEELAEIIDNYAQKAATVAAGFSLVPGPLGMILLFKELQTILQTQIDLLAHLVLRLHKHDLVTEELLMNIYGTLAGNVGLTIVSSQGQKLLMRQLTRSMSEKAAKSIGVRLAQKGGYHVLAKWLPIAGSGIMYLHTFHATRKLGRRAVHLIDKGIIIDTEASPA